jgi:hypothetical protein
LFGEKEIVVYRWSVEEKACPNKPVSVWFVEKIERKKQF